MTTYFIKTKTTLFKPNKTHTKRHSHLSYKKTIYQNTKKLKQYKLKNIKKYSLLTTEDQYVIDNEDMVTSSDDIYGAEAGVIPLDSLVQLESGLSVDVEVVDEKNFDEVALKGLKFLEENDTKMAIGCFVGCERAIEEGLVVLKGKEEVKFLSNLAYCYQMEKMKGKSKDVYEELLPLMREVYGRNTKMYGRVLVNYAELLSDMAMPNDAIEIAKECVNVFRDIDEGGPLHGIALRNLAGFHHANRETDKAKKICNQALKILRRELGQHNDATKDTFNLYYDILYALKDIDEIEDLTTDWKIIDKEKNVTLPKDFSAEEIEAMQDKIMGKLSTDPFMPPDMDLGEEDYDDEEDDEVEVSGKKGKQPKTKSKKKALKKQKESHQNINEDIYGKIKDKMKNGNSFSHQIDMGDIMENEESPLSDEEAARHIEQQFDEGLKHENDEDDDNDETTEMKERRIAEENFYKERDQFREDNKELYDEFLEQQKDFEEKNGDDMAASVEKWRNEFEKEEAEGIEATVPPDQRKKEFEFDDFFGDYSKEKFSMMNPRLFKKALVELEDIKKLPEFDDLSKQSTQPMSKEKLIEMTQKHDMFMQKDWNVMNKTPSHPTSWVNVEIPFEAPEPVNIDPKWTTV